MFKQNYRSELCVIFHLSRSVFKEDIRPVHVRWILSLGIPHTALAQHILMFLAQHNL